eukprot:12882024-Alexandrium_andersonii.AAC.1
MGWAVGPLDAAPKDVALVDPVQTISPMPSGARLTVYFHCLGSSLISAYQGSTAISEGHFLQPVR